MSSTRVKLRAACLLAAFALAALFFSTPGAAESQYDRDISSAQACFDKVPQRSRNTLHCIGRIVRYTDQHASMMKCAMRLTNQGLFFLHFPLFRYNSDDSLWLLSTDAVSVLDVDRETAATIRLDCRRAYSSNTKVVPVLGNYVYLRALILEQSNLSRESERMSLPALNEAEQRREFVEVIDDIVSRCKSGNFRRILVCEHALLMPKQPGNTSYDKFLYALVTRESK